MTVIASQTTKVIKKASEKINKITSALTSCFNKYSFNPHPPQPGENHDDNSEVDPLSEVKKEEKPKKEEHREERREEKK